MTDSKMIDRIRKLFAMSQDASSENEAKIALKRMQFLMQEHGLTEADLATSEFAKDNSFLGKSLPAWKSMLSLGIAKFTSTIVTIERTSGREKKIQFAGYEADVKTALLLSDYLEQTLARCVATYKRESGETGKAASTSFSNGFAVALQRRMIELSEEMAAESPQTTTGTSLVIKKMGMVNREFGIQRSSNKSRATSHSDAASAGRSAGQNVNLNRQVSGGGQKALPRSF